MEVRYDDMPDGGYSRFSGDCVLLVGLGLIILCFLGAIWCAVRH